MKDYTLFPRFADFAWEECNGGIRILRMLSAEPGAWIPDEIDGRPVTTIGSDCFFGLESLQQVRLPSEIREIENGAFGLCCNLKQLSLSEGIEKIGHHSFRDSGLTSIRVPGSVKRLEKSVFSFCSRLKHVELQEGLQEIGTNAFYHTSITRSDPVVIPASVKLIEPGAFWGGPFGPVPVSANRSPDPVWFEEQF